MIENIAVFDFEIGYNIQFDIRMLKYIKLIEKKLKKIVSI